MRNRNILITIFVAGYLFAGCLSFALAEDETKSVAKKYARRGEGVLVSQERKVVNDLSCQSKKDKGG